MKWLSRQPVTRNGLVLDPKLDIVKGGPQSPKTYRQLQTRLKACLLKYAKKKHREESVFLSAATGLPTLGAVQYTGALPFFYPRAQIGPLSTLQAC